MLPALLNVPTNPDEWSEWAWHHRDSHDRIRGAIKNAFGEDLTDYQIEPIAPQAMDEFLQNNSQLHSDMNGALRLQTNNILDAQLSDPGKLRAWINIHYLEHYDAETKAGA